MTDKITKGTHENPLNSAYDRFGGALRLELGVTTPPYIHSDETAVHGASFGLDSELRMPYGFGVETELALTHYANDRKITDLDYIAAHQKFDGSDFVERSDESYYWLPTAVKWHSPLWYATKKTDYNALSFDAGVGVAAQKKFSGSEIAETVSYSGSTTYSGTSTDANGQSFDSTYTTASAGSGATNIIEGHRDVAWGSVPFVDVGLSWNMLMYSSSYDDAAVIRLGYKRYIDPNAPRDPGYVMLSCGYNGFLFKREK